MNSCTMAGDAPHTAERAPDYEEQATVLGIAGSYPTESALAERGLVVLALDHPYWILHGSEDERWHLAVEPAIFARVLVQLERYELERASWPPCPKTPILPSSPTRWVASLLWVLATLAVFRGQLLEPGTWEQAGALEPGAVFGRGEWWRIFTALFLHADVGHLTANLIAGAAVFAAVDTTLGRARGWLLLAVAAAWGNLASAALHAAGPAYQSIGASTAVFAGLGLLTGRACRAAVFHRLQDRGAGLAALRPLATGCVLLALYGAGAAPTDVVSHLTGMAAGLALGYHASGATFTSAAARNRSDAARRRG